MTDNEIIKALKLCTSEDMGCEDGCPYVSVSGCISEDNENILLKDVFDLINRQKAEIERYLHSIKLLEKDVETAKKELKQFKALYVDKVAQMGINYFAERLCEGRVTNDPVVIAVKTELKLIESKGGAE